MPEGITTPAVTSGGKSRNDDNDTCLLAPPCQGTEEQEHGNSGVRDGTAVRLRVPAAPARVTAAPVQTPACAARDPRAGLPESPAHGTAAPRPGSPRSHSGHTITDKFQKKPINSE